MAWTYLRGKGHLGDHVYLYIYGLFRGSALGDVFNMSESVQSVLIPILWGFVNIFCPSLGFRCYGPYYKGQGSNKVPCFPCLTSAQLFSAPTSAMQRGLCVRMSYFELAKTEGMDS